MELYHVSSSSPSMVEIRVPLQRRRNVLAEVLNARLEASLQSFCLAVAKSWNSWSTVILRPEERRTGSASSMARSRVSSSVLLS